ncbi:MAG: TipAS antibiotic-recognition domain-containing protein [Evtepia gabavorous]
MTGRGTRRNAGPTPGRLRPAGGYCGLEGKPGETAIRRGDSLGAAQAEAEELIAAFARSRPLPPEHPQVQALTGRWQAHITRHHYCCTRQTLAGLGELYRTDQRFQAYLDQWGIGNRSADGGGHCGVLWGTGGVMLPQKNNLLHIASDRRCGGG